MGACPATVTQHDDCHFSAIPFPALECAFEEGLLSWRQYGAEVVLKLPNLCLYPTDPARLVRTESVRVTSTTLSQPPRYSDLHISQTLPKTNKINKVRLGFFWVQVCWVGGLAR